MSYGHGHEIQHQTRHADRTPEEEALSDLARRARYEYPSLIKDPATESARLDDMRARAAARLARLGIAEPGADPALYSPPLDADGRPIPFSQPLPEDVGMPDDTGAEGPSDVPADLEAPDEQAAG